MQRRENTFRIDYAKIPKKPSYEDLHYFVGTVLGMKREEVLRLQCSRYLNCAFVKASSLEVAERVVREHDNKHEMEVDNKKYPLRMWMENGGVDVKIHDLSEDVNDENIALFMQEYGDILSIRELSWDTKFTFGDIPTGVRIVRMVVKKNIPSIVTIDGETTCISYSGQLHTCRHCNELAHNGVSCIQNKKLLLQKLQAENISYAGVTKQSDATSAMAVNRSRTTVSPTEVGQKHNKRSSTINTSNIKQNDAMPPPPVPSPSTSSFRDSDFPTLSKPSAHQTTTGQQRTDGHESDSSTTSNQSRRLRDRPPGKKMRHDTTDNSTNNI